MIRRRGSGEWALSPSPAAGRGGARRDGRSRGPGLLVRPVGPASWDPLLYGCGGAAAVSLLVWQLWPHARELVAFVWLMAFTSSALSTFLPAASEPILIVFGTVYPPLLLAALGVIGIGLVECVNYRLFGAVLHAPRLASLREARLMRLAARWFGAAPFGTVVVCALTPVPFWMARTCAVVVRYPMGRFIVATIIGRFPRLWLVALLGTVVPFTTREVALGGAALALGFAVAAALRRRIRAREKRGAR